MTTGQIKSQEDQAFGKFEAGDRCPLAMTTMTDTPVYNSRACDRKLIKSISKEVISN